MCGLLYLGFHYTHKHSVFPATYDATNDKSHPVINKVFLRVYYPRHVCVQKQSDIWEHFRQKNSYLSRECFS